MVGNHAGPSEGVQALICLRFAADADAAELERFKHGLIEAPTTLHCSDCSGSFDFVAEACCESLDAYQLWLDGLRQDGRGLVQAFEHCLICRRYIAEEREQDALWLPMADGLRKVPFALIDRVEAEGDYVRVVAAGTSSLVHATLRSLEDCLLPAGFLKLHRSLLVRHDLVEALVHDDHGWSCRLNDGSRHRLPRARLEAVRTRLHAEPPMQNHRPANGGQVHRIEDQADRRSDERLMLRS